MSIPYLTTADENLIISTGINRYQQDNFIEGTRIMDKLLSTKRVAEYLDISPLTVRRKVKSGEIPSIRIGHQLRFDKQQIDRWLLEKSNRRPIQILVVDDEPLVGELFKHSLNESGYQVTTTLSSIEALELLNARHFDLIFLDLLIPEIDGAELFRRIRQKDKRIPVAIITGYPDSEVMKRAIAYGPFMVMDKPFTVDDILNTVQSFVEGVTTRRGA
jgi:excisionase family DNA binding protein